MSRMMRNERNARRNNLFSFAAPIAVAAVILVVVVKAIFSIGSGTNDAERTAGVGVKIVPTTANGEVNIYMSGDSKKKIESEEWLLPSDNRMEVKSGDAEIVIEGSASKIYAERGAEVAYKGKNAAGSYEFELQNSYLWVEAGAEDLSFKLKTFTAKPKAGSVVVFFQNAVGSNAFVMKGNVEVATETSNAPVGVNQRVQILTNEAKDMTVAAAIMPIDSFFRLENVYLKHDGDKYLLGTSGGTGGADSGSGAAAQSPGANSKPIILLSPEDEASFDSATADFEGKIVSDLVAKVQIGEKEAKIDAEAKTFAFKGYPLPANANDIVYKAFDKEGGLIYKAVVTVYSSSKSKTTETAAKPSVTTYPVSDKEFRIVAPTENPYKTQENVVRIEGRLPKGVAKYVTINGFRLSKFPQFGTYWYYFANKDYGTMNDGINTYEIKYYGEDDQLLKTSQFIIVKDQAAKEEPEPSAVAPTGAASGSGTPAVSTTDKPL